MHKLFKLLVRSAPRGKWLLPFMSLAVIFALTPMAALARSGPPVSSAPSRAPASATVTRLKLIIVNGVRYGASGFNLPTTVFTVGQRKITQGRQQLNLSESLKAVPGILVRNRYDFAEGEQVSIRGFGATAPFGVQGVRLIIDGIPTTMPDGQGQARIFDLPSLQRIEVIEGPFSVLYGNAAGGVILGYTRNGPIIPTVGLRYWYGSYASHQETLSGGAASGPLNYFTALSRFRTAGFRDHSAANRTHLNAKITYDLGSGSDLSFVVNGLNQDAEDPSGLTVAQMAANPRQARQAVYTYDARKAIRNRQGGVVWHEWIGPANALHLAVYNGYRRVLMFLPFGGNFGLSAGGVVDLHEYFGGGNTHWTHSGSMVGVPYTMAVGLDYQRENEYRKGFVNANGAIGSLRSNEYEMVDSFAQFFQGRWDLTPRWSLSAGVRNNLVRFSSRDFYTITTNPDDSGAARYTSTDPVAGVLYRLAPRVRLYANYGRGFQTPTFYQLAYRPNGLPGLNFSLLPMTSNNYEVGTRMRLGAVHLDAAMFHIVTANEIVVSSSAHGRTSYANAGKTRRNGLDFSLSTPLVHHLHLQLAYSFLDARFSASSPYSGKRLPGVPRNRLYFGLDWTPPVLGFYTTLGVWLQGRVLTDSTNSAYAGGYARIDWSAGLRQKLGDWRLAEFLRVDNVLGRTYVSAVVIGDKYGHYYEPGPGRNYTVGVDIKRSF